MSKLPATLAENDRYVASVMNALGAVLVGRKTQRLRFSRKTIDQLVGTRVVVTIYPDAIEVSLGDADDELRPGVVYRHVIP